MKVLDFFMYYLSLYYIKRPEAVSWSSPEQRAIYALSLITTSWLLALEFFVFVYFFKPVNSEYLLLNILIVFGLLRIYNYIYVTRRRLDKLRSSRFNFFNLNENICMLIAFIGLIISFILPCAILVLNMPVVNK